MREQHLENIEACHRRTDELKAPPSAPYRGLAFAHLCEAHDRIYYGGWRRPVATPGDFRRASRQIERYLDALTRECERSHAGEGRRFLEQAHVAFARVDPDVSSADTIGLDNALSHAHRALNALLHQYRMPTHDPEAFVGFYDVTQVPFREVM